MFCHLVAHQLLTWDQYWLPLPFQNSFSYCGLQIFRFSFSLVISLCSIFFFRIKFAFSSILYFFLLHFQRHLLHCIHDRLIPELHKFFIANVWIHITHTTFVFFHRGSCSCVLLNFIFITYITFFFQMFHVNMLQHLFWASMAFSLFTFIVWKTFFMLFSPYFLFFFKSHLHTYFFLLNIAVLLVVFDLII